MADVQLDNPTNIDIALAIFKWAVTVALSSLAARHVITVDQSQRLLDDLTHKAIAYAPTLVPLAFIIWKVIKNRARLVTALWKAKLTENEVKEMIADPNTTTPTVKTPSNTVPGVPTT